jgi:hypothetical protein
MSALLSSEFPPAPSGKYPQFEPSSSQRQGFFYDSIQRPYVVHVKKIFMRSNQQKDGWRMAWRGRDSGSLETWM